MNWPLDVSFAGWLAVAALVTVANVGDANAASERSQTANGLVFYYGVVPAEVVRGHPPKHAERAMHGGGDGWHIVLAIFDAETGVRVTEADVQATVSMGGVVRWSKPLEPMPIAGAMTFGNYFPLSSPGSYRIRFTVDRERCATATATFEFKVPSP